MSTLTGTELRDEIERTLRSHGIDAVGVTTVDPFDEVRRSLEDRRARGFHAGMSFTFSNPRRSTEPSRLLRNAASMVVGALSYVEERPARPSSTSARIARYAWRDHYADLRAALDAGAGVLRTAGHRAMVIADQNGLVDRAAAHRAGIGWWGRNANLLIPGAGSWFVLGSIVTDAALPPASEPVADGCRTCRRCIPACPTEAIVDDGTIDARRCLAWLVQDTGMFPRAHRVALGDRLYGCDDCQDVCPPGRSTVGSAVSLGPTGGPPDAWVDVLDLLDAPDETLLDRHGRWYIPRREPRYLRRNALVVLGNVGDPRNQRVVDMLRRFMSHDDRLLRAHAVWACARLGLVDLVASAADDPDAAVRAEVAMAPTVPPSPSSLVPAGSTR
ncbi:tRNA epoxyqueuosine(34) reductase QueG [Actinospongicola halichondriae]|uniref:tRNA epoxyqueuosine(34) reductase QueG n=1 Tax=Actinospongicola halichondriae TaxID=3236844 RepID=UPI003D59C0E5